MLRRFFRLNAGKKALTLDTLNVHVREAEYAVRGRVVAEAAALQLKLDEQDEESEDKLPFTSITQCNIGNPQACGQSPLKYNREVLALVSNPLLMEDKGVGSVFAADAIDRAQYLISQTSPNNGAYTHSKGFTFVRESVAEYIAQRDETEAPNTEHIYLTNGASGGVMDTLNLLIRSPEDGIMVPIPQYPLYSAGIRMLNGTMVPYYLDEANQWALSAEGLAKSYQENVAKGINVRALVVINPGNPTGSVLGEENIRTILEFASEKGLLVMADEVYQENIYTAEKPFHSFRKVLLSMPTAISENLELISYHSVSKGIGGECGLRGGYMELTNIDPEVEAEFYKLASVKLCPNVQGQIAVELMVNPPSLGDDSYNSYKEQYTEIFESLKRRAALLTETLNSLEGVQCNPVEGSMYVFPSLTLPPKAIEAAKEEGIQPDMLYVLECLHETGIIFVPGSGFGQLPGTHHYRGTFLPSEEDMAGVCERLAAFHAGFLERYSS